MSFNHSQHGLPAGLTDVQREHYEIARSFQGKFATKEFRELYQERFPERPTGSILPADFAHNNNQVAKDRYPWFLERAGRGVYRFVGLIHRP
jgi:hypothetical protein